ncbi:MAG: TolC family protein, partial [Acidobacteriota bacterium]
TTLPSSNTLQGAAVLKSDNRNASVVYTDPFALGGTLQVSVSSNRQQTNSRFNLLNPRYDSRFTVNYTQSLLRNFGYDVNRAGIRIARRNTQISESQFRQTVLDVLAQVEKAYWDLKFAAEDLKVKEHSLQLSHQTLEENRIRVDVGTMAPIDVTTAEAEVASRQEAVLLARNAMDNARDQLLLNLNQPRSSALWVLPVRPVDEPDFDADLKIDLEQAIADAMEHRPDLEQVRLAMENDRDEVTRAKSQMRWDLTGTAQYGRTGLSGDAASVTVPDPVNPGLFITIPAQDESVFDSLKEFYSQEFDNWLASIQLVIPLGNKQAKANYISTRVQQEQRGKTLENATLAAIIQVRTAARSVANTIERVKAARVSVRLQREKLEAENKRYENGMTTTFTLFQIQDDLVQAERQVILAQVDYSKALADLEAAKGTLAEARGVHLADLLTGEAAP